MRVLIVCLLLFLAPISFAGVEWSYLATDSINGKVAVAQSRAIFTSYDNNVYAVMLQTGTISWTYDTGEKIILEPVLADSKTVAVATETGSLIFLNAQDGRKKLSIETRKPPHSIAASSGMVFLASEKTIMAFDSSGESKWNASFSDMPGQIGTSNEVLYVTSGGKMYCIAASSGTTKWISASEDSFLSKPVEYTGTVYFGATDQRLYALDHSSGKVRWSFKTGGWILSTPVQSGNAIYFGSNDGYLYSITKAGQLRFRFKTGDGIWGEPLIQNDLVVFGSNDGNLYGIDANTGEEAWSFSAGGRIGPPVEHNNAFLFGTSKGRVYHLSPSPICSFTWPSTGDAVGDWPLDVEGKARSDSGISKVEIRVDKGVWVPAYGEQEWHASADFAGLAQGAVKVECRATDKSGKTETGDYASIILVKTENVPLQKMFVSAPYEVEPNESFELGIKDSRGKDLHNVLLKIGETEKPGDSPFLITLGKSGEVKIVLEKPGFGPEEAIIKGKGGIDFTLVLGVLVVLIIAGAAYIVLVKNKGT